MNDKTKMITNLIFRLLIFTCIILSAIMIYNLVTFAMLMDKNDSEYTDEFVEAIMNFSKMFRALFFITIPCIILSVISYCKCSKAAVVVRTFFLTAVAVLMAMSLKLISAFIEICDALYEIDTTDLNSITAKKLEDAGISASRADELSKMFENADYAIYMAAGMSLCTLVYLVLTFTSLHNLLKKKKEDK